MFGGSSAIYEAPAVPIAYEHCLRILHEMDADLDEFITEMDVLSFVTKHGLPFQDAEVHSMFVEANSSGNGLMDVEQLGKAVSYKFPHRRHNDDWVRLFNLSPRPEAGQRLTALVPPPLEQEPVRANFEQEPSILTFSPLTKAGASASRGGGFGFTASSLYSADSAAFSAGGRSTTPFNTAPRPLYAGARLGTDAERDHEKEVNRYMLAEAHLRAPAAPASLPLGRDAQSFAFHQEGPPPRMGFEAQAAFSRSVEEAHRTSAGVGWKHGILPEELKMRQEMQPRPLYYGMHDKDFFYTPCACNDWIPLRTDGEVTRVTGEKATAALRLMITEGSFTANASANSRMHKGQLYPADVSAKPFNTTFQKASNRDRDLKRLAAQDRLEIADGTVYPPLNDFMNGKPTAYKFRPENPDPDRVPPGAPPFITSSLGRAWPKINNVGEGVGPSVIAAANPPHTCPSLRVQLTENIHHAARSTRSGLTSDAYSYPPTMV